MKSKSSSSRPEGLFPFPLISHNVEGLSARHYQRGAIIYRIVVLALLVAAGSLPFIRVDVSSRSRGTLRPTTEINQVITATGGLVAHHRLAENATVCAGDTLLTLSTGEIQDRRRLLVAEIEENHRYAADLDQLLNASEAGYPRLQTALYQREYARYRRELDEAELKLTHAEREAERAARLHAAGSLSLMESEKSAFEAELARAARDNLIHQRRRLWTQERERYRRDARELKAETERLNRRARDYVVTAPVDGTVIQFGGLETGNFVTPGQPIATIAPDDRLRVEVSVPPTDIGLIRTGMPVKLQLDAFHHNRWGMATGRVEEIANDVIAQEGVAVFVVKCALDQEALHLANGFEGRFKAGMSLTAHFLLARRSLFDLLHDKLDDWLHPTNAR